MLMFGVIFKLSLFNVPNNDIVALSMLSVSPIEDVSKRKIDLNNIFQLSVVLSDVILK